MRLAEPASADDNLDQRHKSTSSIKSSRPSRMMKKIVGQSCDQRRQNSVFMF